MSDGGAVAADRNDEPRRAGKWRAEYVESLRGKRVVVIADADAPGVRHAHDVCRSLIGKVESLKLVSVAPKKDLSDWVADGGTLEGLLALIRSTPKLTREDVSAWSESVKCESKGQDGFRLTKLADLMSEPDEEISYLLDDILPASGLSLLAAKPKAGKSTFARCLALAVSRGDEFLNRITVQGPVVYLALEEKRAEVRRHFRELGADGTEPIYVHCAAAPQDALPALLQAVKQYKPVLVIVDPILRMSRVRDANDYAVVSNALEPLMSLAREHGAHLLLIYHLGKGARAEATDQILGSTAFFAGVDTALIMKRTDQYRTIQSRQRYGDDLPETILKFDPDTRSVSLGLTRGEADAERLSKEILDYLEKCEEAKTEDEILANVEGRNRAKRDALRALVAQQKVDREGEGKRGSPYNYQRFQDSRTAYIPGTGIRETEKAGETRMDTDAILVPDFSGS